MRSTQWQLRSWEPPQHSLKDRGKPEEPVSRRLIAGLTGYILTLKTELLVYNNPVRTSQETQYVTAINSNRLMLFRDTVIVYWRTIRNKQMH
jgi:hypothetical protein